MLNPIVEVLLGNCTCFLIEPVPDLATIFVFEDQAQKRNHYKQHKQQPEVMKRRAVLTSNKIKEKAQKQHEVAQKRKTYQSHKVGPLNDNNNNNTNKKQTNKQKQ